MKNKKLLLSFMAFALVASGAFAAVAQAKNGGDDDDKFDDSKMGLKLGVMMKDKWYGEHKEMVNKKGSPFEVHINNDGSVVVRGGKVAALSGTTITALTEWNGAMLNWNINTDANTKFIELKNGQSNISQVKVGDFISFTGNLMAGPTFTVQAKSVKNWSVMPQVKTTVEGKVVTVPGATAPTTFTLKSGDKAYSVKVSATTSVLNAKWLTATLGSFQVDNKVRVYGVINADNTIDATVVRNVSQN